MKLTKIIFLISVVLIAGSFVLAQHPPSDEWTRLQTDDGKFSIEVPARFSYFYDKDGFQVSQSSSDYRLRDVNIVNACYGGTLVSFEVYRGEHFALEPLAKSTIPWDLGLKKTSFKGIAVREIERTEDGYYFISRYFRSKNFIYVVSALSRTGETPAMRRFFESLVFKPDFQESISRSHFAVRGECHADRYTHKGRCSRAGSFTRLQGAGLGSRRQTTRSRE